MRGSRAVQAHRLTSPLPALVTIWNSNEPWFAFRHLLTQTLRSVSQRDGNMKPSRAADLWYGIILAITALVVFGSSMALGVIVPSLMQIGNSAPVEPSSLFYLATPTFDDSLQLIRHFGLQALGAMRALGSVEASDVTVRRQVQFKDESPTGLVDGNRIAEFTYGYSLTGVDFGLQLAPHLQLTVKGTCKTEDSWFASDNTTASTEIHHFWNNRDQPFPVPYAASDIKLGPRVSFQTKKAPT